MGLALALQKEYICARCAVVGNQVERPRLGLPFSGVYRKLTDYTTGIVRVVIGLSGQSWYLVCLSCGMFSQPLSFPHGRSPHYTLSVFIYTTCKVSGLCKH